MTDDRFINLDIEAGQRVQERIQFYFLTLTFTLLALSIQTSSFSNNPIQIKSELLGWLFLFISGLTGLHRMSEIPKYFKISVHVNELRGNLARAEEEKYEKKATEIYSPRDRKKYDIIEYIVEHHNGIEHFEKEIKKLDKKLKPIIYTHRICLLLGIILVMFSRSIEGLSKLW